MATRKKTKRAKSPARSYANGGGIQLAEAPEDVVLIAADGGMQPFQPNAAREIVLEDGSVEIDLNPEPEEPKEQKFEDNIAETLAETSEGKTALDLCADHRHEHQVAETVAGLLEAAGAGKTGSKSTTTDPDGRAPV